MKKLNKEKKKNILSLKRTFSNNLYVLRIIQKRAPLYLFTYYLWSVAGAILDFFTSTWLVRKAINDYQQGRSLKSIITVVVILLILNLVYGMYCNLVSNFIFARYRQRIVEAIESALFEKAAKVELECYENPEFYDRYVRATDNAFERCMNVVYTTDQFLYSIIYIISGATLLIIIDPLIALFALVPLLMGLVMKERNKTRKNRDDDRRPVDRVQSYVQRTFYLGEYAKEMRLTDFPRLMKKKYAETVGRYREIQKKYGFKSVMLKIVTDSGNRIVQLMIMVYAAARMIFGSMLAGDCLTVFNTSGSFSGNIALVQYFEEFRDHALYIEDLRYFMDYVPKISENAGGPPARPGDIVLKNVSFCYKGANKNALSSINMTIHRGEKIALVGHNGSGKTTLVKLLLHLYEQSSGEITLDGTPLRDFDQISLREQFSVVFQDFKLFSMSVAENVLLRPLRDGDISLVTEALKQSGAYEKVSSLKKGVETTLTREFDDEGAVLSVGEAQKVSLARIFTNSSPFVVLDEPSSALDPIAEYNMFSNMMKACKDRTLIFISHRMASAVMADRVYLLEDGEITEEGSHSELMAKGGRYYELFSKQAENYIKGGESDGKER